jgi:putative two-component system response regulator
MILNPDFEVVQATGGAQALELLGKQSVDLITLDLQMPGLHGRELMPLLQERYPQVPVIVITGCSSIASATEGIRCGISDYLEKPFDVAQVKQAVLRALGERRARAKLAALVTALGNTADEDLDGLRAEAAQLDSANSIEATGQAAFLLRLAETLELREPSMSGHARRVAFSAELLAHRLGLSAIEHNQLYLAAILHDLGNAGLPPGLLARPDSLTEAEFEHVDEHTRIGEKLLAPLALPAAVLSAIRHHHEWWDGEGQPDGLRGARIPLAARIIAICDGFDAMSNDRPYRAALPRDAVIAELRRGAGSHYDPDLVKEFLAILETGVCELDPQWVAEIVSQATALDPE